jgi:hypothetical protein
MTISFQLTLNFSPEAKAWLEPLMASISDNIAALTAVTSELKASVTAIEAALAVAVQGDLTADQAAALDTAVISLQAVQASIAAALPPAPAPTS